MLATAAPIHTCVGTALNSALTDKKSFSGGTAPLRTPAILGAPPSDPREMWTRSWPRPDDQANYTEAAAVADPSNGQSLSWSLEAATAADLA